MCIIGNLAFSLQGLRSFSTREISVSMIYSHCRANFQFPSGRRCGSFRTESRVPIAIESCDVEKSQCDKYLILDTFLLPSLAEYSMYSKIECNAKRYSIGYTVYTELAETQRRRLSLGGKGIKRPSELTVSPVASQTSINR